MRDSRLLSWRWLEGNEEWMKKNSLSCQCILTGEASIITVVAVHLVLPKPGYYFQPVSASNVPTIISTARDLMMSMSRRIDADSGKFPSLLLEVTLSRWAYIRAGWSLPPRNRCFYNYLRRITFLATCRRRWSRYRVVIGSFFAIIAVEAATVNHQRCAPEKSRFFRRSKTKNIGLVVMIPSSFSTPKRLLNCVQNFVDKLSIRLQLKLVAIVDSLFYPLAIERETHLPP
jgi:hypothetical protein